MTKLKLRLADGSEIEATLETPLGGGMGDLLATGYHGNKMRISADESDDVQGHSAGPIVNVRLFDEDDTEGQAMTLRLPNADAARDLQRKLLAAGVVGVIVIGAATTAIWAQDQGASVGTGQAVAAPAPAPAWANPAVRDRGAEDAVAPIVAPAAANPAIRDRGAEDVTSPLVAPAAANPAVRDRGAEDTVAPVIAAPLVAPASANPALRDRGAEDVVAPATSVPVAPASANPAVRDRGGDANTSSESGSQSAPGESRLR